MAKRQAGTIGHCSQCGAAVAPNAQFCHICGNEVAAGIPTSTSPRKRGFPWRIVFGIIALLVVYSLVRPSTNQTRTQPVAMIAKTATAHVPTSTPEATSRAKTTAQQTQEAKQQRIDAATAAVTATSASLTATAMPTATPLPIPTPTPVPIGSTVGAPASLGTALMTDDLAVTVESAYFAYSFGNAIPRGGYKVMIVQVSLRNNGSGNERYDASDFSGIDATTDIAYNPVTLENAGVLLRDGSLQPGEYVSGTVLIEVQETATNVIIKYDPDMFSTQDLYWS